MGVADNRKAVNGSLPPMVIDADALYHLSHEKEWQNKVSTDIVLTPHPGEMSLLTWLPVDEIQNDRIEIARKHARQWKVTLVLKGALTVIADPEGNVSVVPVATASLAKAGTGDVLSGMIGGLIAQGLKPSLAAVAGAYLHARAGLKAEELIGCSESVLASDVVRAIPLIYRNLKTTTPHKGRSYFEVRGYSAAGFSSSSTTGFFLIVAAALSAVVLMRVLVFSLASAATFSAL